MRITHTGARCGRRPRRPFCCSITPCWRDRRPRPSYPAGCDAYGLEHRDETRHAVFVDGRRLQECREARRCASFQCARCGSVVGWCRGAGDEHELWCDSCAQEAAAPAQENCDRGEYPTARCV